MPTKVGIQFFGSSLFGVGKARRDGGGVDGLARAGVFFARGIDGYAGQGTVWFGLWMEEIGVDLWLMS